VGESVVSTLEASTAASITLQQMKRAHRKTIQGEFNLTDLDENRQTRPNGPGKV
jgi:hypothetical protein